MNEEIKQLLIEYLDTNNLTYSIKPTKIIHNCINEEHEDNNASAFTSLVEDKVFCSCSSCGFYLNENSLLNFLGIGELSQEDKLKRLLMKTKKLLHNSEMNNANITTETTKTETKKVYLPPKHKMFSEMIKPNKENVTEYRGITPPTFNLVGAYVTNKDHYYTKRIIFPMYDYKNNLKSFEAVSTSKGVLPKILRPSGLNDDYFGFENLIGKIESKYPNLVIINEGLFSALSCIELGYQGLINFGVGVNTEKISGLLANGVTHIILFGDKDEAGRGMNGKFMRLLRKSFCVRFARHKFLAEEKTDSNDYLKRGELESVLEKTIKGWIY